MGEKLKDVSIYLNPFALEIAKTLFGHFECKRVKKFAYFSRSKYSQTCLKQAAKGQGKIACLRQVLA